MAGSVRTKLSPTNVVEVFQESWGLSQQIHAHTFYAQEAEASCGIPEGPYDPEWVNTVSVDVARLGLNATEHRVRARRAQTEIHALSKQIHQDYKGVRVTVTDHCGVSIWPLLELVDEDGEEKLWVTNHRAQRPEAVTGYITRMFLPGITKPPPGFPDTKFSEETPVRHRRHKIELPENALYVHPVQRGGHPNRRQRFDVTVLDDHGEPRVSIDFNA